MYDFNPWNNLALLHALDVFGRSRKVDRDGRESEAILSPQRKSVVRRAVLWFTSAGPSETTETGPTAPSRLAAREPASAADAVRPRHRSRPTLLRSGPLDARSDFARGGAKDSSAA